MGERAGGSLVFLIIGMGLIAFPATAQTAGDGEDAISHNGKKIDICKPDKGWKGFATAEEAEAAASDTAPVCVVDEAKIKKQEKVDKKPVDKPASDESVEGPAPTPGHHHNGAQTNDRYKGGRATIEVTNPEVTHPVGGTPFEFVASRVMAKKWSLSNWLEVGWAEVSWRGDDQYVYTFTDGDGQWHFYDDYSLTKGSYYKFRTERCFIDGAYKTCAYLLWDGSWQLLDRTPNGCTYDGGSDSQRCFLEEYTEIYSEDSTPHPHMTVGGNAVHWEDTRIRPGSTFVSWSDASYPSSEGEADPYSVCWTQNDWKFKVKKYAC